jgi:3-oxoacyl-[acyl-carrier protein] reductase
VASAEDVAAAVLACATHLGYSTGTTLTIDGGRAL